MADMTPTPPEALQKLREEIAMHVQLTAALGPDETLSRIMDTIAGYTRAAQPVSVAPDDEALIAAHAEAVINMHGVDVHSSYFKDAQRECHAAEEALRRRLAELRDALRDYARRDSTDAKRMRLAIVDARRRLAKGRAMWNGPCHECDGVLAKALTVNNDPPSDGDAAEYEAAFNLNWETSQRAIKEWQKANPHLGDMVWPDATKLLVWLMDEHVRLGARVTEIDDEYSDSWKARAETAEAALAACRDKTIEECAACAEDFDVRPTGSYATRTYIATAIRALKDKEPNRG